MRRKAALCVLKPLGIAVFLCAALPGFHLFAGDKIEVDRSTKIEIPNQKSDREIGSNVKVDLEKPSLGGETFAPPQQGGRVMDRSLQELIDRKKNWLFYAPNEGLEESDAASEFLDKSNKDMFDEEKIFRPKSERFMSGEDNTKQETSSTSYSLDPEPIRENESFERDNRKSDRETEETEEEAGINPEFNIRSYLNPSAAAEERGLSRFAIERKAVNFRSQYERENLTETRRKETEALEKTRAAEFERLLNSGAANPFSKGGNSLDPLKAIGPDLTKTEANPISPIFSKDESLAPSSSPRFGSRAIESVAPNVSVIDRGVQVPRAPGFIQPPSVLQSPAANRIQPAPFQLDIPKRKF